MFQWHRLLHEWLYNLWNVWRILLPLNCSLGAQALDLRQRDDGYQAPKQLQNLHEAIRQKVEFWDDDDVLHPAISSLSQMVRDGHIDDICPLPMLYT